MYYMLRCLSPQEGDHAMLSYKRDTPLRSWVSGKRFRVPPPVPIKVQVERGYSGIYAEFWSTPVPLMTKRLHAELLKAGVANLDVYDAEIFNPENNTTSRDHLAVNIIGLVAAADLGKSKFDPSQPERMTSMDFDSVTLKPEATRGELLFRLAESVNAIVVHERVKQQIEAAGINTLTFITPENWVG